jgi:hypothetical protein
MMSLDSPAALLERASQLGVSLAAPMPRRIEGMVMNISALRSTKGGATFGANALNERSSLLVKSAQRDAASDARPQNFAEPNPGAIDPLIQALVDRLPRSNSVWSIDDRAKWLKAVAMVFNLIYKTDNG